MRIKLNLPEVNLLHKVLFNPYGLPLSAVRVSQERGLLPWRPKTEGKEARRSGKQFHALKEWFNKHVAESVEYQDGNPFHKFPKADFETGLTQTYVDFLIEILEHYEPVGLLAELADIYVPLMAKLRGEQYVLEDPFQDVQPEGAKNAPA